VWMPLWTPSAEEVTAGAHTARSGNVPARRDERSGQTHRACAPMRCLKALIAILEAIQE